MKNLKDLSKEFLENLTYPPEDHPLDHLEEHGSNGSVYLFDYEYFELCRRYGQDYIDVKIEDLVNYMAAHGKNYHSHYHALKLFIRNDQCTCEAWKKNVKGLNDE